MSEAKTLAAGPASGRTGGQAGFSAGGPGARLDGEAGGPTGREPLLECHGLVVGYGGQPLLPSIDLVVQRGELWAVVGRNGAGKTTWFRTLLGLLPPVRGRVELSGTVRLGYIPQRARLDPLVPLRVVDVVGMGLVRGRDFLRPRMSAAERARVDAALQTMGVQELACRRFGEISEGQKQRVLMARLLAGEPDVAVLDEPTAAMDEVAEREALERIEAMRRERGVAFLIVTHHLPVVARFAERVVFLDRDQGVAVAGRAAEVFEHSAFRARYGRFAPHEPRQPGEPGREDGHAS